MAMTVDSAILAVVVAFLLPLRLFSLAVRLKSSGSAGDLRRSCTAFAVAAALLAAIFALPRVHVGLSGHCAASATFAGEDGMGRELRSEIEQLKLQLNRLESLWENNSKASDNRDRVADKDSDVVKAMGMDIAALIKEQENIKELLWSSDSTIKSVANEVQILAEESRKTNSDVHTIWSLANDTEKTVEALHTDVEKVQALTHESRKLGTSIRQVWLLAKDTGKKVESLYADIEKVQIVSDISRKMESNMQKMWSYARQTEKRVENLYSNVKKDFKKGAKLPFWPNW